MDYLQRYPDTEVDAVFLDRVVNLLEEGLDVGIRIGPLADYSMGALKVGSVRHIVCAAHSFTDWRFKNTQTIRVKPRLTVTSNDVAIEAAKQGLGITRLLSYQVVESLAAGDLKIVLEDFEPPSLPVSIVHREGRFASSKVRSFIDLMAQRLRDDKALN